MAQVCGAPRMAYVQAAEGKVRAGWRREQLLMGWPQQVYIWSCRSTERVTGQGGDIFWRKVGVGRDLHSRLVPKSCRKKVKI